MGKYGDALPRFNHTFRIECGDCFRFEYDRNAEFQFLGWCPRHPDEIGMDSDYCLDGFVPRPKYIKEQ